MDLTSRAFSLLGRPRPTLHYAETRDGWQLALYRYEPRTKRPQQSPVVLCHGLGVNRYNMDAPGRNSLAKYIASQGYDTWVVELRGAGRSYRPTRWLKRRRVTYDWNFDDYVHHDVPAIVTTIMKRTGSRDVHWVGHSMGGMVGYAFLTYAEQHHLRSLVTIASPTFSGLRTPWVDGLINFKGILKVLRRVPQRQAVWLNAPLLAVASQYVDFLANPANMDPLFAARLLPLAAENMSSALLTQFLDWYRSQDFRGSYGTHSYKANLRDIAVPVYILAGSVDRLSPPDDIRYVYDHLASEDKQLTLCGVETGFSIDYGHVDLVVGRRAPDEIFPLVASWLATH